MQQLRKSQITIIGGGLTGLTLAFYLKRAGKEVTIIERNHEAGGVIRTFTEQGFTYEAGPNTGVLSSPELVQLFDNLGDACQLEVANPRAKRRLILKNGSWEALPHSFSSAIATPLFSFYDKFRILGEPFRKKGNNPYETLDKLVLRRLGKSYLEYAVDPFISGIYAGDPTNLVTKFALPKLYNLEQNYGSFIRGAIKKSKEPKSVLEQRATKDVFSVKGGLQQLTIALTTAIGNENFIFNANNPSVTLQDGKYYTTTQANSSEITIESEMLITTTGSYELENLLTFLSHDELDPIVNMRYAKVAQLALGYKEWNGFPLNGFGGLIPSKENRKVLGILFPSSIFPNRAPENGALLSVFLGGIQHEDVYNLPDEQLIDTALNEVSETLKTNLKPDIIHLFRYPHAIAQYERSSEERFSQIALLEQRHKGLILGGNICNGIGMADRVKQGAMIAERILKEY